MVDQSRAAEFSRRLVERGLRSASDNRNLFLDPASLNDVLERLKKRPGYHFEESSLKTSGSSVLPAHHIMRIVICHDGKEFSASGSIYQEVVLEALWKLVGM